MSDWCFDWYEFIIYGLGADEVVVIFFWVFDLIDFVLGKGMYGY